MRGCGIYAGYAQLELKVITWVKCWYFQKLRIQFLLKKSYDF